MSFVGGVRKLFREVLLGGFSLLVPLNVLFASSNLVVALILIGRRSLMIFDE